MTSVNQTGIIAKQKQERENTVSIVDQKKTLHTLLEKRKGEIQKALPSTVSLDRFMRVALTALDKTPNLYKCSESSFYGAIMLCAQIGLEPNTPLGLAHLVPYNNTNKAKALGVDKYFECNFQIGYPGMLELAYRTGKYALIQAHEAYENDELDFALGLEPYLKHKPTPSNRGKLTHVYAIYHLKDGGKAFSIASVAEIKEHAKRFSKTYNSKLDAFSGPWGTDFGSMAKKTMLLNLLKYAPKSVELAVIQSSDEKVMEVKDNELTYVDEDGVVQEMTEIQEEGTDNE